jgi:ankyrin repeat protein
MKRSALVAATLVSVLALASGPRADELELIGAVQQRDEVRVGAILKEAADVNAPQPDGATALAWAAHLDEVGIADQLIRAGAEPNVANDLGFSPLMLAAGNGSARMIERLIRAGADVRRARSSGETALMMAARAGGLEAVKLLLAGGADVNARTARGQTALMWAAAERHPRVVRLLLEAGAEVGARSASRTPPNRNYAGRQDNEVARGPRPLLKDNEALNPEYRRDLLRSREGPRPEGGFTPLLFGVLSGDVETVRLLLAAGASINDQAADGMTALVLAIVKKHTPLAVYLLEQGADPNAAGTGYAALHVASATGQVEVVKSLLGHGADPNARLEKPVSLTEAFVTGTRVSPGAGWVDIKGATPFMIAARSVEIEVMRLLLAGGADAQATADDGTTAAMLAAGLGKRANADIGYFTWDEPRAVQAIEIGLAAGIDVNARNADGETALHAAAYHAANAIISFLVDRGARLNATNWQNQTPLLIAQGHLICCTTFVRHPDTAALLRKLGADPSAGTRLNFGLGNYVEDALKPR